MAASDTEIIGIGHKLHILTNMILRSAKRAYPALIGVQPVEAWVIRNIGNRGTVTARAVAGEISADEGQVSRAIATLIDTGMVRRVGDTDDRRKKVVTLTAKGKKAFAEIQRHYVSRQRRLLDGLDEHQQKALVAALDTIAANAEVLLAADQTETALKPQCQRRHTTDT